MALASTVAAAPGWADWAQKDCPDCPAADCPVDTCVQQDDAEDIVNRFIAVLNHPDVKAANATAQALLGDDFYEESDSINMLAGHPVSLSHPLLYPRTLSDLDTAR